MTLSLITAILKDSDYKAEQFTQEEIHAFEQTIVTEKDKYFVNCFIRDKKIQLKPEEIVRQLYIGQLINHYGYDKQDIRLEHTITFGREKKSADIVVMDKEHKNSEYIIIEVKKPKLKDGKEQLKSYCHATGTPIAVFKEAMPNKGYGDTNRKPSRGK